METFLVIFGLPLLSVIWFVASLIVFLRTPKEHKKRHANKIMMIVSAVVAAVLVIGSVSLTVLFMLAIAHM